MGNGKSGEATEHLKSTTVLANVETAFSRDVKPVRSVQSRKSSATVAAVKQTPAKRNTFALPSSRAAIRNVSQVPMVKTKVVPKPVVSKVSIKMEVKVEKMAVVTKKKVAAISVVGVLLQFNNFSV